jgi:phosphodiesterase/alkaline phosphatase D-like protein
MPATTTEQIIEALRPVEDPELRRSIVDLGMVRKASLDNDGVVDVLIALTVAGCPLRNEITSRVTAAVAPLPGVKRVALDFTVMTDPEREAVRMMVHGNPGDTAGQGWGIDSARGGMRTYRTMLENRPDFFIHSGDHIYADCPIPSELRLPNGEIWRNIVTEVKSTVARSLAQFRGNYKYNLLDVNLSAFNAQVPMLAQWDDHEVTNDWSPIGTADETGYADDGTSRLVHRARRAFHEFRPIRATLGQAGRIYRRVGYGPLLDVFLIDMRNYRDSTWNKGDDPTDTFI